MTSFAELNALPAEQITNLNELGYLTMTRFRPPHYRPFSRVKMSVRRPKPAAENRRIRHQGCYSISMPDTLRPRLWFLCPTRELADQVAGELRPSARYLPNIKILTLCGGVPFGAQRDSLIHPPHIIVAASRLIDHLNKDTLHLDAVRTLVLDRS